MNVPSLENARFSEAVFVTWQDGPCVQRSVRSKIQRHPRRDAQSTKDDDENSIVNGFRDDIGNDLLYRFKRCVYLWPRMVAFQFKTTLTIDDMGVAAASGRLRFRETVHFKPKMVEVRQSERFIAGGQIDDNEEAIGDRLSWGKPGKKNGHRSFVSKVVRSQTAAVETHYVTAVHIPSPVVAVSVSDDLGNGPQQVLVNDVHIYIDRY